MFRALLRDWAGARRRVWRRVFGALWRIGKRDRTRHPRSQAHTPLNIESVCGTDFPVGPCQPGSDIRPTGKSVPGKGGTRKRSAGVAGRVTDSAGGQRARAFSLSMPRAAAREGQRVPARQHGKSANGSPAGSRRHTSVPNVVNGLRRREAFPLPSSACLLLRHCSSEHNSFVLLYSDRTPSTICVHS